MSQLKRNKAVTEHNIWVRTNSFPSVCLFPEPCLSLHTELNPGLPKATKTVLPSRAGIKLQESTFW